MVESETTASVFALANPSDPGSFFGDLTSLRHSIMIGKRLPMVNQ